MQQSLKNTHKSKIKEHNLGREIYVAHIDNFTDSTDTILKGIDKRFIQFYFCSKGNLTFNFNNGLYKFNLKDGNSFLFYNPMLEMPLDLNVSAQSKVFIVALSIKTMHAIFSEYSIDNNFLEETQFDDYYQQKKFPHSMRSIFHQIETINLDTPFEKMFLMAKVYEIFTLYFADIEGKREYCPYLDNEIQAKKLKMAKEILMSNLQNPPNIKDLADEVQLSEYYLKEGFKKIYGNTVYGFVLDKKLEMAREKLITSNQKVKDIAFEIGYENPSHFIAAFKKKYGITPKQFTKELG